MKILVTAICLALLPLGAQAVDLEQGKPGQSMSASAVLEVVAPAMTSHDLTARVINSGATENTVIADGNVVYSSAKERTVYKWGAGEPTDDPARIIISGTKNPENKMTVNIAALAGGVEEEAPEGYAISIKADKGASTNHSYVLKKYQKEPVPVDKYDVKVIAYDWIM